MQNFKRELQISKEILNFKDILPRVSLFSRDFPALSCAVNVANNDRKNNYDIVYDQVYRTFHNIREIISAICNSSFPSF